MEPIRVTHDKECLLHPQTIYTVKMEYVICLFRLELITLCAELSQHHMTLCKL